MSTVDLQDLTWHKSSRSGTGANDNCVEIAFAGSLVAVRDSKNPANAVLTFPAGAFTQWTGHTRRA
jgi:Domain of unknown function (DUF397)